MKIIITGVTFFLLGLLIGMYESEKLFLHLKAHPIIAVIMGIIIAGGIGLIIRFSGKRKPKSEENNLNKESH